MARWKTFLQVSNTFIKLLVGSPGLGELEGLQGRSGALAEQWRAWDWYRTTNYRAEWQW